MFPTPTHKVYEVGKDQKYFSKRIIIEPERKGAEKYKYNIETRKGKDYTPYVQHQTRTASTDAKRVGKVMDVLKGVQYFTKNIVIQPVPIDYKSGRKGSYSENISSNKSNKGKDWKDESSSKFGNNNLVYSSGKQSYSGRFEKKKEKKPWVAEIKNGEDIFAGIQSETEALSESMIKALDSFDDNTKFFHKEITIRPVFIPPLKLNKH